MATPHNPFLDFLISNIKDTIRKAKKDGTTAMGIETLRQMTKTPSPGLAGAPNGINAQYYYARMFEKAVSLLPKALTNFVLP